MQLGIEDFLALGLQLALLGAPLVVGLRAARGAGFAGAERAVVAALVALAATLPVLLLLGLAKQLRPVPIALAVGLACVLVERLGPGSGVSPAPAREAASGSRTLGIAALVVSLPIALGALLRAPWRWDDLTYHLLYPSIWLQRGALVVPDLPAPHVKAATFPAGGELLHALAMSIVRSDLLVPLVGVVWVALFGLATAALARAVGATGRASGACGLLAATLPTVLSRAATAYVDGLLDFALVAALLFVVRLASAPCGRIGREAFLAGVATGVAAGVKYIGAPVAVALGLAIPLLVAARTRRVRSALAAAALFALPVVLVAAPWYLRNLLLTGNPVWPAPFGDLPALEHPLYPWHGTSVAARFGELAGSGVLSEALFAIPRGATSMSLGWPLLVAVPLTLVGLGRALAEGARALARRELGPAVRALTPAAGLVLFGGLFLALPTWNNDGLFRSEVRFAAPAAALALVLAVRELERFRRGTQLAAALGVGGALLHLLLAGVLPPLGALPGVALLPITLLAGAGALGWKAQRAGSRVRRGVAAAAALGIGLAGLALAWTVREATRTTTVEDPRGDGSPAAPAEMARFASTLDGELAGRRRIAFAATVNYEFAYLLVGPRLERSVEWIPPCDDDGRAWPRAAGAPCRELSPETWRRRLSASGIDALVVSRWGLGGGRWPEENDWAGAAGWPLLVDFPGYRAWALPAGSASGGVAGAARVDGRRGGPQPERQARAR